MKFKPWLVVLFCLSLALTGCVSTGASNPTAVPTSTAAPTATLTPTPAPTPTPQPTVDLFVIDPAKFHNFPESYEYLLAHRDEFVQAPDPLSDRAAFDQWYNEEFIPALGPVSERRIDVIDGIGYEDGEFRASACSDISHEPSGFFYFTDGDIIRPVVVENIGSMDSRFIVTLAVTLFDFGNGFNGLDEIQRISDGYEIRTVSIFTHLDNLNGLREFPKNFIFVERFMEAGFVGRFDDNRVTFGAGYIEAWGK